MKTITLALLMYLQTDSVIICTGPNSCTYHTKTTCQGLYKCYRNTTKVSLTNAVDMGRTPCKMCHHKK